MEETFEYENPVKGGAGKEQIEGVLAEVGVSIDDSPDSPVTFPTQDNLARADGSIDENKVYEELSSLISAGKQIVNNLSYVDINAEGALSGIASVLASVRQMLNDFNKIHQDHLKFIRQKEIEQMKIDAKFKAMERKHQMDMEKIRLVKGEIETDDSGNNPKLNYSQQDLVKMIAEANAEAKSEPPKKS